MVIRMCRFYLFISNRFANSTKTVLYSRRFKILGIVLITLNDSPILHDRAFLLGELI
jgi:hypothetical protein